jgi:hypothetical protein
MLQVHVPVMLLDSGLCKGQSAQCGLDYMQGILYIPGITVQRKMGIFQGVKHTDLMFLEGIWVI